MDRLARRATFGFVAALLFGACGSDAESDARAEGARTVDVAGTASTVGATGARIEPDTVTQDPVRRARIVDAAREIVAAVPWASLATVDGRGQPRVRVMDAVLPDEDFVVRMATNPRSAKVAQIRARPDVAVHWVDAEAPSSVTLLGRARLIDDGDEKLRWWKASWDPFYPDGPAGALMIEVVPTRLEVVSPRHGLEGDTATWAADAVQLERTGAAVPPG